LKLWLLDADVIIDLLGLNIFDKLLVHHEIHAASTVIDEVKFYIRNNQRTPIAFRKDYVVDNRRIYEVSASVEEVQDTLLKLPISRRDTLHAGELESLAVLLRKTDLTFCTCDAATIRALPFFSLSERGISVETLLKKSGLSQSGLIDRHTEAYFENNLSIGQRNKMEQFGNKS
jgi:hypothetical protein